MAVVVPRRNVAKVRRINVLYVMTNLRFFICSIVGLTSIRRFCRIQYTCGPCSVARGLASFNDRKCLNRPLLQRVHAMEPTRYPVLHSAVDSTTLSAGMTLFVLHDEPS